MSRVFGFFKERISRGAGARPAEGTIVTITPVISDSGFTVTYTIDTNLSEGIELDYAISGVSADTFTSSLTGTIILDVNGDATIVKNVAYPVLDNSTLTLVISSNGFNLASHVGAAIAELSISSNITLLSGNSSAQYDFTSNYANGTVVVYSLTNTQGSDFTDGFATGNLVVGSGGSFSITKTLDIDANYTANTVNVAMNITTPTSNTLVHTTSNINLGPGNAFIATGGVVNVVNGYNIHEFNNVGTESFTITTKTNDSVSILVERLLLGGGGSGGNGTDFTTAVGSKGHPWGGGGSAGQVVYSNVYASTYSVTSYNVTVGDGGTGGSNTSSGYGGNTSHANVTAIGGSPGGDWDTLYSTVDGRFSGAGGGAGTSFPFAYYTGTGIRYINGGVDTTATVKGGNAIQIGTGLTVNPTSNWDIRQAASAGGSGAGSTGYNATYNAGAKSASASNGGDGIITTITGSNVTIAAGGGGSASINIGLGGSGIGGNGSNPSADATAGAENTGSGGGGGAYGASSTIKAPGDGGSGKVVIRYPIEYRLFST